ncbi:hypothetical protein Purlil1_12128 [Purpureocillium lilacinum]|uniref:Uncharacterized protein n=1 Tax=Purpureocillium lilacinum TaxID=33203 RepID=A0ABR0BHQ6_PURLI|nr:hypothetical protein Purlil1_12128 [Purpureocillium lilacinum]
MGRCRVCNPFRRREKYSPGSMLVAKALSVCSWLTSVVVSVHYGTTGAAHDTGHNEGTWARNYAQPSSFTLNSTLGGLFWASLLNWQVLYLAQLFSRDASRVHSAAAVCGHFTASNALHVVFTALFVKSLFRWAEGILLLNFVNLTVMQCRHKGLPIQVHLPAISFPLSWTFFALYWNGFMMVPNQSEVAARVAGSIIVWAILGYGLFSLLAQKDYALCFCLSFLSVAVGVGQLERLASVPELISPFIIGTMLLFAPIAWLRCSRVSPCAKESEPRVDEESDAALEKGPVV